MIDTHNHILPGLDDGPAEKDESLEMCRIAWEDGVKTVVATPHFNRTFANEPEQIRAAVDELNGSLTASEIGLRIVPGMEVRVSGELLQDLRNGRLLPLNNNKHVLLEFHAQHIPAGFQNLVNRFLDSGLSVILAHPEKNHLIQRDPRFVFRLLERFEPWQVMMQLTADSLTGDSGFWAAQTARLLLKCGLAHLIATDAHSSDRRTPRLARAVEKVRRIVGEERANLMTHDIPMAILNGTAFPAAWPRREPKAWWRFLR
jgi:protein-tyrosine phosphatase